MYDTYVNIYDHIYNLTWNSKQHDDSPLAVWFKGVFFGGEKSGEIPNPKSTIYSACSLGFWWVQPLQTPPFSTAVAQASKGVASGMACVQKSSITAPTKPHCSTSSVCVIENPPKKNIPKHFWDDNGSLFFVFAVPLKCTLS